MDLTEHRDLRGGEPLWIADDASHSISDELHDRQVEIAIVGAGIMGAALADRLSRSGREVLLLDRRPPAHGSTAASTALVMWGADVPLTHLAKQIGTQAAGRRWRTVHRAVRELADDLDRRGIECDRIDRPELYLAGTLLDEDALVEEGKLRRSFSLPSTFLDPQAIATRFEIAPRAALLSADSYEIDPVKLTLALLACARAAGARCCFPADVQRIEQQGSSTILHLDGGRSLKADQVIFATGYERASLFLPDAFTITSSYAIATQPHVAPLWGENALIWEASSPYLYCRATADGRIVAGGEDEDFSDEARRDALIEPKAGTLEGKLAAALNVASISAEKKWAAAFGSSPDGLPAIGKSRNHEGLWLAAGFGGNGVTFAALASQIIAAGIDGSPDADAECFDPYRFEGARNCA